MLVVKFKKFYSKVGELKNSDFFIGFVSSLPFYSDTLRGQNFLSICKTMTIHWICGASVACSLEW